MIFRVEKLNDIADYFEARANVKLQQAREGTFSVAARREMMAEVHAYTEFVSVLRATQVVLPLSKPKSRTQKVLLPEGTISTVPRTKDPESALA